MSELPNISKEIFVGSMLGDGSLRYTCREASLCISRAQKDIKYLQYQFKYFKDFCKTGIVTKSVYDKRTKKYYHKCYFHTLSNPIFTKYYYEWYPSGYKTVPKNLKLTPLICAIWFCDDGCVAVPNENTLVLKLSTNGFSKQEVEYLSNLLKEELHENFFVSKVKDNQYVINAGTAATIKFITYIGDLSLFKMSRKITWNHNTVLKSRKSNALSKLERSIKIFQLLKIGPQTRINIGKYINLLSYNKKKKCAYLRQDITKFLENLVENQYITRTRNKNINHYNITNLGKKYLQLLQQQYESFGVINV